MLALLNRAKRNGHISTAVFTASRLACTALSMVGGLLTVRLVAPATLGYFNTVSLGQGYLTWLQAGIFNGLNRELPYLYGKGDPEKAHEMAATAQFWAVLLGGVTFAGFAIAGAVSFIFGKHWLGAALLANAVLAFTSFYNGYLGITFRTKHDFVKLAGIDLSVSVFALALLALVWGWNFYGVCLRSSLIPLATLFLLFVFRPVRVHAVWSAANFKHLMTTGLPIYMVGQVFTWWNGSITPTWVAWKCGIEAIGLYAFVSFAYTSTSIFALSISQVYYPRLIEDYAKFHDLRRLFHILRRPTIFLLLTNLLFFATGWLVIPHAIFWFAPKYVDATFPVQCALLSCLVYVFYPIMNIFNVVKKQTTYLICMLIGMALHLSTLLLLVRGQSGLHMFVLAELIGKVGFVLACIVALCGLSRQQVVTKSDQSVFFSTAN